MIVTNCKQIGYVHSAPAMGATWDAALCPWTARVWAMGISSPRTVLAALFALSLAFGAERASARRDEAAAAMAQAARAFLEGLDGTERGRAALSFEDPARLDWHFVPREHVGLSLGEMEPEDRARFDRLLATGLSESGRGKFEGVLELEALLFEQESKPGQPATGRDPAHYHLAVFGEPGSGPWGWRLEGHHWSVSFTVGTPDDPSRIAVTPNFLGANPAKTQKGTRPGFELLGPEEARARTFLAALTPEERARARLPGATPADVILAPGRARLDEPPAGIRAKELSAEQSVLLLALVDGYFADLSPELADRERTRLSAHSTDNLWFAWSGEEGAPAPRYWRVQGDTFAVEFVYPAGTVNHAHRLWRDFERDLGGTGLREHLEREK
jgi:hypothetical protein